MQPRPQLAEDAVHTKGAERGIDKRRTSRFELNVEIGIDDDTNFYVGFSENISSGGLFIATYRLMPVGTEVAMTFVLPDTDPMSVHGIVRWQRDPRDLGASDVAPGMGIEFRDLKPADQARIEAYIHDRAPLFYPD